MLTIFQHPLFSLALRIFLGLIFILAAVEKVANPDAFAKNIGNYHLLPYEWLNIAALTMSWIELFCGIFLLMGVKVRAVSLTTSGLLVVFIIAIVSAVLRGFSIECGCFAQESAALAEKASKVGWTKVAEDVGYLAAAVALYFFPGTRWGFFTSEE